jgi:hypothetical protein
MTRGKAAKRKCFNGKGIISPEVSYEEKGTGET